MESFLSPSDIAALRDDVGDAWETSRQLQDGGVTIVFAYTDPETQNRMYTAPQVVTIRYPKTGAPRVVADASGEDVTVNMIIKHPVPFNCKRGYTFGFGPEGEEKRGEILVVYDPVLGIVRADAHLSI
jgi:hypothetical protein